MGSTLPAVRLSQVLTETAFKGRERIAVFVRMTSPVVTTHCRQAGLPIELAELCGGLLASVVDDLVEVSRLRRTDFERSKRMDRILATTEEPAVSALRLAMACSPINGRACVRHWDAVCEKHEVGKLAWLLGVDTETAYTYGKRISKINEKST